MDKKMIKMLGILLGLLLLLFIFILISNGLKGGKKYTYDEISTEAISATKKYLNNNTSRKPNADNTKTIVTIDSLVEGKYMKEPSVLLKDDNASCSGEVEVYYLEDKKYDYIPEITCVIKGETYNSKNLVNKLLGEGDYNVVFEDSGIYKRINGKWITNDDDLNSAGSEDIVEYYYRGNQEALLKNYVQIDDMLFRVVMVDNDENLLLIYNDNIQKGAPWDKRYNEEVNKTQGINTYKENGVKSAAIEKVESFILGDEKLENKVKFSSSLKYLVQEMTLCTGKRALTDKGTDGSIECETKLERQKAGLLPAYMYMSASIDPTCEETGDKSCGNNNYLATYDNSYCLVTTNSEKSNECYYVNRSITSGVCSSNTSFKPIITITGRVQYSEGDGSKKTPYVINTKYYKTETNSKKK
jgi:hypothetical protein